MALPENWRSITAGVSAPEPTEPTFVNTSYSREEPNRLEKMIGTVLEPVVGIPGVLPTLEKMAIPGEVVGGLASSIVGSTIQELRERGFGQSALGIAASPFQVLASPITGDAGIFSDIKERQREMLGMTEEQKTSILGELKAARAFQRDRDSLFFGEKFLTESVFDPTIWLAGPAFRAAGLAGRIPGAAVRQRSITGGVRGAYRDQTAKALRKKRREVAKKQARREVVAARRKNQLDEDGNPKVYALYDTFEEVIAARFNPTTLRNALQNVIKAREGQVAAIGFAAKIANPEVVLSKALDGDQAALSLVAHKIVEETAEQVLQVDKNRILLLEKKAGIASRMDDAGNNVVDMVRRSDQGVDTVQFGDLMERALTPEWNDLYVIDDATKDLVRQAHKFLDRNFDEGVSRGMNISKADDLGIVGTPTEGWHYFTRLIDRIRRAGIDRTDDLPFGRYEKGSMWKDRLNETVQETVDNGVPIGGAEMQYPVTTTLEIYAKTVIKDMVDAELITMLTKRRVFEQIRGKRILRLERELKDQRELERLWGRASASLRKGIDNPKVFTAATFRALNRVDPVAAEEVKAIMAQPIRKTGTNNQFRDAVEPGQELTNGERLRAIQGRIRDGHAEKTAKVDEAIEVWGKDEVVKYENWAKEIAAGQKKLRGIKSDLEEIGTELGAAKAASELLIGKRGSKQKARKGYWDEQIRELTAREAAVLLKKGTAEAKLKEINDARNKAIANQGRRLIDAGKRKGEKELRGRPLAIAEATKGIGISENDFDAFMRWMEIPGPEGSGQLLNMASKVSETARFGALTFDQGVALIQGSMVLVNYPRAWLTAVQRSLKALLDPESRFGLFDDTTKFGRENIETVQQYGGGIGIGVDLFDAVNPGGLVNKALRSDRMPSYVNVPMKSLIERFQSSFEVFMTVARLEIAKTFKYKVDMGEMSAQDVVDFANKFTGVTSSRALGVKSTQRQIESAAFALAPRYFRAITGLMVDATQGGFRGEQARKSMAKFFGASVGAYVGIAAALGQTPKLDPRSTLKGGDGGKFMTVEINGHDVGLGSKPISLMRHLFKAVADPSQLFETEDKLSRNLMLQFARSNMPPLTSLGTDVITGRTFLGEPVEPVNDPIKFLTRDMLGRTLPFWLEAAINDDPGPGLTGTAADFIGLRSWPLNVGDQLDDMRNELAFFYPEERLSTEQREYMYLEGILNPTWDILNQNQKAEIRRGDVSLPEQITGRTKQLERLVDLTDKHHRGRDTTPEIAEYLDGLESARSKWESEADILHKRYQAGRIGAREFKIELDGINSLYAELVGEVIEIHDDGMQLLESNRQEMRERGDFIPTFDEAREYYLKELVADESLTNEYGEFQYAVYDERLRDFRKKFGTEVAEEVRSYSMKNRQTPALVRQWLHDRDVLRPYWNITEEYLRSNPSARLLHERREKAKHLRQLDLVRSLSSNPLLRRMDRQLSERKRRLRERNPRLDATLIFWEYGPTRPLTPMAGAIFNQMLNDSYKAA